MWNYCSDKLGVCRVLRAMYQIRRWLVVAELGFCRGSR